MNEIMMIISMNDNINGNMRSQMTNLYVCVSYMRRSIAARDIYFFNYSNYISLIYFI